MWPEYGNFMVIFRISFTSPTQPTWWLWLAISFFINVLAQTNKTHKERKMPASFSGRGCIIRAKFSPINKRKYFSLFFFENRFQKATFVFPKHFSFGLSHSPFNAVQPSSSWTLRIPFCLRAFFSSTENMWLETQTGREKCRKTKPWMESVVATCYSPAPPSPPSQSGKVFPKCIQAT